MKEELLKILKEAQEGNDANIDDLIDLLYLLDISGFGERASGAIGIAIVPYLISVLISPSLVEAGANPYLVTPALVGGSAAIGVIGESFLYKGRKKKIKLELPNFKNALEKEETHIGLNIEIEKRFALNNILNKIAEKLESGEDVSQVLGIEIDAEIKAYDRWSPAAMVDGINYFNEMLASNAEDINTLLNSFKCI